MSFEIQKLIIGFKKMMSWDIKTFPCCILFIDLIISEITLVTFLQFWISLLTQQNLCFKLDQKRGGHHFIAFGVLIFFGEGGI